MSFHWYVYSLSKPDGSVFYIGKGKGSRMFMHTRPCESRKNRRKGAIIKSLVSQGLVPVSKVLRRFKHEENALAFEVKMIAEIGRWPNGPLANLTDGGEGTSGCVASPEARANMSKAGKGKKKPAGFGERVSKGLRQSKSFADYCKKPKSAETKAKLIAIHTGRKRPPETGRKIGEANRRRRLSQASRDKIAASVKKYYETHTVWNKRA